MMWGGNECGYSSMSIGMVSSQGTVGRKKNKERQREHLMQAGAPARHCLKTTRNVKVFCVSSPHRLENTQKWLQQDKMLRLNPERRFRVLNINRAPVCHRIGDICARKSVQCK